MKIGSIASSCPNPNISEERKVWNPNVQEINKRSGKERKKAIKTETFSAVLYHISAARYFPKRACMGCGNAV
jgi:hypothetical protein